MNDDDFSPGLWLFVAVMILVFLFASDARAETAKMPEFSWSEFWQSAKAAGWFSTLVFGLATWWINKERQEWMARYFTLADKFETKNEEGSNRLHALATQSTTAMDKFAAILGSKNV